VARQVPKLGAKPNNGDPHDHNNGSQEPLDSAAWIGRCVAHDGFLVIGSGNVHSGLIGLVSSQMHRAFIIPCTRRLSTAGSHSRKSPLVGSPIADTEFYALLR